MTLAVVAKKDIDWAAVMELNLSYCAGETILIIIYTHYGNLIPVPYQQPS